MFNKELLLNGGGINTEPHVIMTIDYTSDNIFIYWGYNEGTYRPGSINRKPYWIKGNGNKLTFNKLIDYTDNPPAFYLTGFNFQDGTSYFTAEDTFRLTRADTREVTELFTGRVNQNTFQTRNTHTPFFHDLGQGDSVGIFFDPPPDGYL